MRMPRSPIAFVSLAVLLCLCCSMSCFSQDWSSILSYVLDNSEEEYDEDVLLELESLYYNKINLNDITEDDCAQFFFLSEFERASLLYYVQHNKPLLSVYELQNVLGLPLEKAKVLAEFVYVAPITKKRSISELLEHGKHSIATNVNITNMNSHEYKDLNHYVGGPNKEIVRYRFQSYNTLFYGFTFKKDMGELLSIKEGFDSKSGYIQIKNRGKLANAVFGNYKVSIGQGLILSQGGSFINSIESVGGTQSYVLSKHSSTTEYLYSRGVGISLKLKDIQITPFVSYRKLDGTIKDDEMFPFSISKTGYHRTLLELEKKQKISYVLSGIHAQWQRNRLRLGCAVVGHWFEKDSVTASILNASCFYNYFKRHLRIYGELAIDKQCNLATIQGVQYAISEELLLSSCLRFYQPNYQSFMSSAVGKQSSIGNELGVNTNLKILTGQNTSIIVANDLYQYPRETSTTQVPIVGNDLKLRFTYKTYNGVHAYYQYSFATKTNNGDDGYVLTNKHVHKYYAAFPIHPKIQLKFSAQVVSQNDDSGLLMYSDIVWKQSDRFLLSCRFAKFDASYDNRLYAWEDDVMYLFSNSQYYYDGTYCYAVAKWKFANKFYVQMKLSHTQYSGKYDLPETYDLYRWNRKMQLHIMMQVQL